MTPLVNYHGGKATLARRICALFPAHSVYVEPFAGGASCLFAKPDMPVGNGDHYREVINDKDDRLVTLYRVAQSQPGALRAMIEATPYSKAEYARAKRITESRGADDLTLAWAVYTELQQAFGHSWGSGWGRAVSGNNHAKTWDRKRQRASDQIDRLRGVYIECDDALAVIRRWDSPQALFYCDPPYPSTEQRYEHTYTLADYQALVDLLASCEGSVALSGYDHPDLRIPEDWERHEFGRILTYADNWKSGETTPRHRGEKANARHRRTDVLWIRDRSSDVRPSLVSVLEQNREMWERGTSDTTPSRHR